MVLVVHAEELSSYAPAFMYCTESHEFLQIPAVLNMELWRSFADLLIVYEILWDIPPLSINWLKCIAIVFEYY